MDHFMKKITESLSHSSEYTRDISHVEREQKKMRPLPYNYMEKKEADVRSTCSTDSEDSDCGFPFEKREAIDKALKSRGCIRTRCGKTQAYDYD